MTSDQPLVIDPNRPLVETVLGITPALYRQIGFFLENPATAGGIVRVRDNQLVAMSQASAMHMMNSHTPQSALNYKREDFWHLPDLENFNQEWQQALQPDGSNSLEFSYLSCNPLIGRERDEEGDWKRYHQRYKLIQCPITQELYHVSNTLGSELARRPVSV
ncbi:MAG: hypothetical protein F6K30_06645 [Cyanothece sp. SIO2G6]|nr:hypothetical protein [Cyanothece sp. SIO2G6]